MGTYEIIGAIIIGMVTIGGFVTMIWKFTSPINNLNISIIRLTDAIEMLIKNDKLQDERLSNHGKEIDKLALTQENHAARINHLEKHNKER